MSLMSLVKHFDKVKFDESQIRVQGHNCVKRCENSANSTFPLCTAATEPLLDLDKHYSHSIFSPDPVENPAFFDYDIGKMIFS